MNKLPYANPGDTFYVADRIGTPHDISDQVFFAFTRNELDNLSFTDWTEIVARILNSPSWRAELLRIRAIEPEECTGFDKLLEDPKSARAFWERARSRDHGFIKEETELLLKEWVDQVETELAHLSKVAKQNLRRYVLAFGTMVSNERLKEAGLAVSHRSSESEESNFSDKLDLIQRRFLVSDEQVSRLKRILSL